MSVSLLISSVSDTSISIWGSQAGGRPSHFLHLRTTSSFSLTPLQVFVILQSMVMPLNMTCLHGFQYDHFFLLRQSTYRPSVLLLSLLPLSCFASSTWCNIPHCFVRQKKTKRMCLWSSSLVRPLKALKWRAVRLMLEHIVDLLVEGHRCVQDIMCFKSSHILWDGGDMYIL